MGKIIGAGLSRTGTYSLQQALEILGFRCIHFDRHRLNDVLAGRTPNPDFRRYDDVDGVVDLPSAYFYQDLFTAYPGSKVILTVRDTEAWWRSIQHHLNVECPVPASVSFKHHLAQKLGLEGRLWPESEYDVLRRNLRNCVYGSTEAREFLYKKKYAEHNRQVMATIPKDQLLVMDIAAGDGWEKLCPFLEQPVPDCPFPHGHKRGIK